MKKAILAAITGSALLASGHMASALTYVDADFIGVKLTAGTDNASYTGMFDINGAGHGSWTPPVGVQFDSSTMKVVSAYVAFAFLDDLSPWTDPLRRDEAGTIALEGTTVFSGSTLLYGGAVDQAIVDAHLQDGILHYTITATEGDFWLLGGKMVVHARRMGSDGKPVPDAGATVAMLGLSLLGLAAGRRKLASR